MHSTIPSARRAVRGAIALAAGAVVLGASASLPTGDTAHASVIERLFVRSEFVFDADSPPGRARFFADPIVFATRGPVYAELNVGTFARGLEVGGWWKDPRGSYYSGFVRRRQGGFIDDTAAELQTNQKVGQFVVQGFLRAQWPDRPDDDNLLFIPGAGAELYTGSHAFMALRAVLDPRPNTGMTLLLSNRFAGEHWFVEGLLAPRTDGVLNYAVRGRWRWLYLGYARENDFDFSRIDRSVWILGYYHVLSPGR